MHLFVYGTLRLEHGHPLGIELGQEADPRGRATVRGRLFDVGEYPVAVPSDEQADIIIGEIYHLPSKHRLWSVLDDYEAFYPHDPNCSYFERVTATAEDEAGRACRVQIYWYLRSVDGLLRIEGGDYCRRTSL